MTPPPNPPAEFASVAVTPHAQYLRTLQLIRPRTQQVDFVLLDGSPETSAFILGLAGLTPTHTVTTRSWPGTSRSSRAAVRLSYLYDRNLFRALSQYRSPFLEGEGGDDVETGLPAFENIDISCLDRSGDVFFYTVAHAGVAMLRAEGVRS